MKKNFLFGALATVLIAANVWAFCSVSASAKPEPMLPIEFEGCYQTVSSCGYSSVLRENCTPRQTSHKCTRNYYQCHNCNNAPIILDPIDEPIRPFDPIVGPIRPIDPVEPIVIVSPI